MEKIDANLIKALMKTLLIVPAPIMRIRCGRKGNDWYTFAGRSGRERRRERRKGGGMGVSVFGLLVQDFVRGSCEQAAAEELTCRTPGY